MKTTYIDNGEYRIDEFENIKFLLQRVFIDMKGNPIYEIVGQIER